MENRPDAGEDNARKKGLAPNVSHFGCRLVFDKQGKLLRMNTDGSAAPGNPFVSAHMDQHVARLVLAATAWLVKSGCYSISTR